MKSTGMVRKIDDLGRIVIPIELRRTLGIEIHDPLEIFVAEDHIVLRKYQVGCIFCDETDGIIMFQNKPVCHSCIAKMTDEVKVTEEQPKKLF